MQGKPFAPAGRTFREWVLIDDRDQTRRAELIDYHTRLNLPRWCAMSMSCWR
jgi:hypothetical protein